MTAISKPTDLDLIWASAGDKIKPADDKIQLGWVAEIPTLQNFNYLDNRQDQFIAHVNQFGIPVWDTGTEYLAGRSLVMDINGGIWRCLVDNTGNDPATTSGYWSATLIDANSDVATKKFIGYSLHASDFVAEVNTRYYATAQLKLTLPLPGDAGNVVTVAKSPNITVAIYAPSGILIVTSIGPANDVLFDINDEINLVSNGTGWEV